MKVENMLGKKFGKLTPIERTGSDNFGRAVWLCKCDCGNMKKMASHNLKSAFSSCGCNRRQVRRSSYNLPDSLLGIE